MKLGIVVFDEFTDLDFYLPWDLLNRVRLLKLHSDWNVEILCDDLKIKSAAGLALQPTKPYSFADDCDGLYFCSGSKTRELIHNPGSEGCSKTFCCGRKYRDRGTMFKRRSFSALDD